MQKLYFILGCTACGKGALGRELARRLNGRIISVDSMKIYRRMDIGSGKPSAEVRAEIPHYCVDIVEPSESFSVARFVEFADQAVADIRAAGAIPLAVGGTSLYIKALSEGLFEGPSADPAIRQHLQDRIDHDGLISLYRELLEVDPQAAERIHPNDEKRIVRALEVYQNTGVAISELQHQWDTQRRYDCTLIGLRREKNALNHRINIRAKKMMDDGLVEEVASLLAEPDGIAPQAAQGVGYAEIIDYLHGRCSLEEAFEHVKINTRHLAKKQRTWHKRWTQVQWFDVTDEDTVASVAERVMKQINFE